MWLEMWEEVIEYCNNNNLQHIPKDILKENDTFTEQERCKYRLKRPRTISKKI